MNRNLVVAVRVRPFNAQEEAQNPQSIIRAHANQLTITNATTFDNDDSLRDRRVSDKVFQFDRVFDSCSNVQDAVDQRTIFDDLGVQLLDQAFQGYNCCIFAYGQTGSGKSYTMMGTSTEKGLIPLICDDLFRRISLDSSHNQCTTEVSYLEIYSERVRDLLSPGSKTNLRVREHATTGPYVEGLTKMTTSTYEEIASLIRAGNQQRTIAATNMNATSSRSHAIFTITLTQTTEVGGVPTQRVSKISLVDLAGSERAQRTGAVGKRLKEGADINKSLSSLGRVISALVRQHALGEKAMRSQIPYRDSVLTWLLKDSLGGNSLTAMIATISPGSADYDETLSTLRYADSAKKIKTHAVINEDQNTKIIRQLQEEIALLRTKIDGTEAQDQSPWSNQMISITSSDGSISFVSKAELADRMDQSRRLIADINQSWEEKLEKTRAAHRDLESRLEDLGININDGTIGFGTPRKTPHLVNLSENSFMDEFLVYNLGLGITRCGKGSCDIKLTGSSIMDEHCVFENVESRVSLTPKDRAMVYVNNELLNETRSLSTGDRIVLGRDATHIFRFNNPRESRSARHRGDELPSNSPSAHSALRISEEKIRISTPSPSIGSLGYQQSASLLDKDTVAAIRHDEVMTDDAKRHSKRNSNNEKRLQDLNAARLAAEARGRLPGVSLLERFEVIRDAARVLDDELQRRPRSLDEDLARQAFCQWRQSWRMKMSRNILTESHVLKRAQIMAYRMNMKINLQFCILDGKSLLVSPYEDDIVYEDAVGSLPEPQTSPRLMVRVSDLRRGVATFWSFQKLEETMQRLLSAQQRHSRSMSFLERPYPQYVLFGRAMMPVCLVKTVQERVIALDVYSVHTTMTTAILTIQLTINELSHDDEYKIDLKIVSISGLSEKELSDVHIHAFFEHNSEARLTTKPVSNPRGRHIVLGSRHSCNLSRTNQFETMIFEIYGSPQVDFFPKIISWDEMQESINSKLFEDESQCSSTLCTILTVQIHELNSLGVYSSCEAMTASTEDNAIFQLHQGLSRRISLDFNIQDHWSNAPFRFCNIRVRNIACHEMQGGTIMPEKSSDEAALKIVSQRAVASQDLSEEPTTFRLVCQWDSSMHNTEYLDRTTPIDHVVTLELVLECMHESCHTFEMVVPIALQMRGRGELSDYFSRIFTTMRIMTEETHIYNIPHLSRSVPVKPSLGNIDSSSRKMPGEELLLDWKPRGLSLVQNYLVMSRSQQLAMDKQSTMLKYTAEQLSSHRASTREHKIDLLDIIHYWQGRKRSISMSDLESQVLATYPLDLQKLTSFPMTPGPVVFAGDLSVLAEKKWRKVYCVLRSPMLLQYSASNQLHLMCALHLPLYRLTSSSSTPEFVLYTDGIERTYLASSVETQQIWIRHISRSSNEPRASSY